MHLSIVSLFILHLSYINICECNLLSDLKILIKLNPTSKSLKSTHFHLDQSLVSKSGSKDNQSTIPGSSLWSSHANIITHLVSTPILMIMPTKSEISHVKEHILNDVYMFLRA